MQRVFASVLLVVVGFWLTMPLLVANKSDIPECCRRLGKHRCSAMHEDSASRSEGNPAIHSSSSTCPFLPSAGILPFHSAALVPDASRLIFGDVVRHPACHAQTEARYRISRSHAHQKRGPPVLA